MADIQHCRSCGAPVVWLKNNVTGKPAPINAEVDPKGNILIMSDDQSYMVTNRKWRKDDGSEPYHTNHFVTCPQAGTWHKSGYHTAKVAKDDS